MEINFHQHPSEENEDCWCPPPSCPAHYGRCRLNDGSSPAGPRGPGSIPSRLQKRLPPSDNRLWPPENLQQTVSLPPIHFGAEAWWWPRWAIREKNSGA